MRDYILHKRLTTYKGCNIGLESSDGRNFIQFLNAFMKIHTKYHIYRGTNDLSAYNIDERDLINTFSGKFFMLGDKSCRFLQEGNNRMPLNKSSFMSIFYSIKYKIIDSKFDFFFSNNEEFKNFFNHRSNDNIFVDTIMKCSSDIKLQIQDYYYALLQTMNDKVSNNGCMISTSTSINEAKKYMKGFDRNKRGILIVAWIPKNNNNNPIVRYNDVNRYQSIIAKQGLPVYNQSPFSFQQEICVKYGILPQFIIGYGYLNKFVVNPYLLSQLKTDHNVEDIVNVGIHIDQSDFQKFLEQTRYTRRFTSEVDNLRIILDSLANHIHL